MVVITTENKKEYLDWYYELRDEMEEIWSAIEAFERTLP
jgi:hypothetical protein